MRRTRKTINQINVVPYIDVMLVLLVIFMVTAPLISPGSINLPSVGSKLTVPAEPMQVTLGKDGTWTFEDKQAKTPPVKVSLDELVARIQAKQARLPDQPVVISADRQCALRRRDQDARQIADERRPEGRIAGAAHGPLRWTTPTLTTFAAPRGTPVRAGGRDAPTADGAHAHCVRCPRRGRTVRFGRPRAH